MLPVCFLPLEFNVLKRKSHLFYLTQFLEKCLAHTGNMLNDLIYGKATTPSLALTKRLVFCYFIYQGPMDEFVWELLQALSLFQKTSLGTAYFFLSCI